MSECKTIDDMLAELMSAKEKHGGDCRVRLQVFNDDLKIPFVHVGAVGKSNEWSTVSRGGIPCVLIGE
jgi:hypothetical protein